MPMAGRGSRFSGSGYNRPKPLIEVNGIPMFLLALKSLQNVDYSEIIFVTLEEHEENYKVSDYVKKHLTASFKLVTLKDITEGQLCTVLAAKDFIETDEDILIISSDTIVLSNIGFDIRNKSNNCAGLISVADMPGDRWSFAKINEAGAVIEVAEKVRISNHASTGLYYFANGKKFCELAQELIDSNERTRNEFYVIPLYQKYISQGDFVGITLAYEMYDLGTPESLASYLRLTI